MAEFTLPANLRSFSKPKPVFQIDTPGTWLILSDTHIPHSNDNAVTQAVREAKRLKVSGILLNGDILDCAEISRHDKTMESQPYHTEIAFGVAFIEMLRKEFPKALMVYKSGNHEDRLDAYICKNAPAFRGLEGFNIPTLLHLKENKVEWVQDKRIIKLGKLFVAHGHEYNGSGGVNPARWLYLRSGDCTIMGHCHRTSEHHERNISGYNVATWSVGCACDLNPLWCSQNSWNHGFATVELAKNGDFVVHNRRVFPDGRVY